MDPEFAGMFIKELDYFAEKNKEMVTKILQIFDRAIKEVRENPEAAKQYLKGYTALDDTIIPKTPVLRFKMYSELTDSDITAIQKFYDIFTTHKVIDGRIDGRSLIFKP